MSRLMLLPRELRDEILELIWESPDLSPRTAADYRLTERQLISKADTTARCGDRHVFFEKPREMRATKNPLLAVMLTNWQLYCEAKDAIQRLPQRQLGYVLDVAYMRDVTFWPTWVDVPKTAPYVDTLEMRFRIVDVGHAAATSERAQAMYRVGEEVGSRPGISWAFYHMLRAVIEFGPWGMPNPRARPWRLSGAYEGITVRNLVLDFLPVERPVLPLGPTNRGRPGTRKFKEFFGGRRPSTRHQAASDDDDDNNNNTASDMDLALVPAAKLADWVTKELTRLLERPDQQGFRHGCFFYDRVGRIEVRVGGSISRVIDVGEQLAELQYAMLLAGGRRRRGGQPPQMSAAGLEAFVEWKAGARERREMWGLGNPEAEEGELEAGLDDGQLVWNPDGAW